MMGSVWQVRRGSVWNDSDGGDRVEQDAAEFTLLNIKLLLPVV